eukprot:2043495-Amphidinium_carterae.2
MIVFVSMSTKGVITVDHHAEVSMPRVQARPAGCELMDGSELPKPLQRAPANTEPSTSVQTKQH